MSDDKIERERCSVCGKKIARYGPELDSPGFYCAGCHICDHTACRAEVEGLREVLKMADALFLEIYSNARKVGYDQVEDWGLEGMKLRNLPALSMQGGPEREKKRDGD